MAGLGGIIGQEAAYTASEELGRAAIRYYARAIGDDNPIYTDDGAARRAGYAGIIAPPTLVCESNQFVDRPVDEHGYIGHLWDLRRRDHVMLRGGHEYTFHKPLRPSHIVTSRWRLANISETRTRTGSALVVVESQVTYRDQTNELLATNREIMLYKSVKSGRKTTPREPRQHAPLSGQERVPEFSRTLTIVDLVSYAGATWDWHRLHYDPEFARYMGYSGVVVDGQMLGAFLAQQALFWREGSRVRRMSFRLRSPVFAGETIKVVGWVSPSERSGDVELATVKQEIFVGERLVVSPAMTVVAWRGNQ